MSAAVLQVLAALVTASVGALATLAALSPTGARLKRLERLLALREVGRGSAAEPNLEMAIRRASEEVVIDGEVGRSASGWRSLLLTLVLTAGVMTVVTLGLLADPGEMQRQLVLAGALSVYIFVLVAGAVHLVTVRTRGDKRVELFGAPKAPDLRDDERDEAAHAEDVPSEGDEPVTGVDLQPESASAGGLGEEPEDVEPAAGHAPLDPRARVRGEDGRRL